MKIGFFTETYLPHLNGVTVSLEFAKRELEKAGHTVYIFAPTIPEYKKKEKGVIRLSSMKLASLGHEQRWILPIPNETFRKMLTVKLDVVHGHGGGILSFLGYQLALAKGYPYVLTHHAFVARYAHYILEGKFGTPKMLEVGSRLFCNRSDIVIVPSEKMKVEISSYGVKSPIEVVPNAFDLKRFEAGKKGFLRDKLKLDEEKQILLSVGRLGKEKSFDFLLRSFALIAKKDKTSVLVIVGEGKERANLEKLAGQLKISARVFFLGVVTRNKMPDVYADAGIFVFASTSETQGMVVPEAAAAALPLVLVKDAAFEGTIEEGRNGFEVTAEGEFAEKVLLLLMSKDKRKEFGLYSRKLIEKNFSPEKNIAQLIDVYERAIKFRRDTPRLSNRLQGRVKELFGLFGAVKELSKRLDIE